MKFLLFLVVVLIGLWFWKQRQKKPARPPTPQAGSQVIMLRCGVCGVHVPDTDATAGQRGAYCSAEHRRQAEGL